jgi:hypothetical protein
MAVDALRVQALPRPDRYWVVLGLLMGLGLWATTAAVDRARLDPDEAYAALSTQDFSQPLPDGIRINSRTVRPDGGAEGTLGYVSYVDGRKEAGASGGAVVLSYAVFTSAPRAQSFLADFRRDLSHVSVSGGRTYTLDAIREPHLCVHEAGTDYCMTSIGPVILEADSRLALFNKGADPEIEPLMEATIEHFREVTGGL